MSAYIRGQVCGVDNCPSRLWRIIDGRRTCQYGHVMEGDVEFNDDDDNVTMGGVMTRRLNLTTNAIGNFQSSLSLSQLQSSQQFIKQKKLYGHDANILFLKCFQFILKKQCIQLVSTHGFPEHFVKVVKIFWMKYIKHLDDNDPSSSKNDFNDIIETEEMTDIDENETRNNDITTTTRRKNKNKIGLHMSSTIAILYMASVHLGLPVYTSDFIQWICTTDLVYFKANESLPKAWKETLPNHYLGIFEGGKPPTTLQLQHKVISICHSINFNADFNNLINYEGLVLKLTLLIPLPPEFYTRTLKFIQRIEDTKNLHLIERDTRNFTQHHLYPEIKVITYFILTIKYILLLDEQAPRKKYKSSWIRSLLLQHQKLISTLDPSKNTVDKTIAQTVYDENKKDLFDWSNQETTTYLDWIEKSYLSLQGESSSEFDDTMSVDQRIARRKLYQIFRLISNEGQSKTSTTSQQRDPTFIEELQEKYAQLQSLSGNDDGNDSLDEDDGTDYENRKTLIHQLQCLIVDKITLEFNIPKEDMIRCVSRTERDCSHKIKTKEIAHQSC
ncbi:Rrn7p NDAI_0I02290 [Naumovozyma dairenensis CBS 421]|uniref:Uncharacterized protein n=1 Tax=Naumovozyma dairenensis (strain ATCC 10597 / BCRC 20456 / CBS 421 / NBRC 0211 / NRRL Y-12639) TaxID=1071378 RepID=G0WG87_NAUDC|nr:hypothetical protein NDAI_0I02290 [Naumovozyma dairenensis CBS 421]CCD26798.1 hypothetical protein NDAI_0I02290 [Naumovozyma dairenensis CBS 421]